MQTDDRNPIAGEDLFDGGPAAACDIERMLGGRFQPPAGTVLASGELEGIKFALADEGVLDRFGGDGGGDIEFVTRQDEIAGCQRFDRLPAVGANRLSACSSHCIHRLRRAGSLADESIRVTRVTLVRHQNHLIPKALESVGLHDCLEILKRAYTNWLVITPCCITLVAHLQHDSAGRQSDYFYLALMITPWA